MRYAPAHCFAKPAQQLGKIEDYGQLVQGGRIDKHWRSIPIEELEYLGARYGISEPWTMHSRDFCEKFALQSVEFGNWVTQEERANMLYASAVSFYHLAQILNVPFSKIGFNNRLSLAIGARGHNRAKAHFEQYDNFIINLTRLNGKNSLAHEYGHALDNFLGLELELDKKNLYTNKLFTDTTSTNNYQALVKEILLTVCTDKYLDGLAGNEYLLKIEEIWARTFETFVSYELKKLGLVNEWLAKPISYLTKNKHYPNAAAIAQVAPLMRQLITLSFNAAPSKVVAMPTLKVAEKPKTNSDAGVYRMPLTEIETAVKEFQNRKSHYSQESVSRIIEAVKAGTFSWAALDPIVIWKAHNAAKYWVLSGHSCFEAFKQLTAMGYKQFATIPTKVFEGTKEQAKAFALNSNTLSTKETDTERANYFRNMRQAGTPDKEVIAQAKAQEGANATRIIAYSYLNPIGKAITDLERFARSEDTTRNTVANISNWIGQARQRYPMLTNAHENELYDWLNQGGYGNKPGQISNLALFLNKVNELVMKNTEFGNFNSTSPLNIARNIYQSPVEREYNEQLAEAKRLLKEASDTRDKKRRELIARQASESDFVRIMKPFDDAVYLATQTINSLLAKRSEVLEASANQTALFGIGRLML